MVLKPGKINGVVPVNPACHSPKGQLAGSKGFTQVTKAPWTTLVAVGTERKRKNGRQTYIGRPSNVARSHVILRSHSGQSSGTPSLRAEVLTCETILDARPQETPRRSHQ
jgi:hypothetical protein